MMDANVAGTTQGELASRRDFANPSQEPRPPPPPEIDIRAYEGFARFLKEHASPKSKRVTAGGRVVSVGPISPPQTFHTEFLDRLLHECEASKGKEANIKEKSGPQWQQAPRQGHAPTGDFTHGYRPQPVQVAHQLSEAGPSIRGEHGLKIPPPWKVVQVDDNGSTALIVNGDTVYRARLGPQGQTMFSLLQATSVRVSPISEPSSLC